ncbi:hypothetical protein [Marinicella sp. W31]|uniref:hypothetical protein n=1 Tax=Marinicella sp. W31 TaxID=3023713 RepID=UPI003756DF59
MIKFFYCCSFALLFSTLSHAQEPRSCDDKCQLQQVNVYFAALTKVFRAGSTEQDVDALLANMHNSIKYIHVEYLAEFNKDSWRQAFLRNLNNGAYTRGPNDKMVILNTIHGKNHLAVEYVYDTQNESGSIERGNKLFALFGLTDGKISLIQEYW